MIQRVDRATTGAVIVLIIGYLAVASGYPGGAKLVPMILASVALVIAVIQFLSPWVAHLRTLAGQPPAEEEGEVFTNPTFRRRLVTVVGSLVLVPVAVVLVGLPVTLPLYVAVFMLLDRQRPAVMLAATGMIAAASYGLLLVLLAMSWNDGYLWRLL